MQRYAASKSLTIAHLIVQHPFEKVDIYPPALCWRHEGLVLLHQCCLRKLFSRYRAILLSFSIFPYHQVKAVRVCLWNVCVYVPKIGFLRLIAVFGCLRYIVSRLQALYLRLRWNALQRRVMSSSDCTADCCFRIKLMICIHFCLKIHCYVHHDHRSNWDFSF